MLIYDFSEAVRAAAVVGDDSNATVRRMYGIGEHEDRKHAMSLTCECTTGSWKGNIRDK
jgi:hypothetical protein